MKEPGPGEYGASPYNIPAIEHPSWKHAAKRLHGRSKLLYKTRYRAPHEFVQAIWDLKRLELWRDLGSEGWTRYLIRTWGPLWKRVRAFGRLGEVLIRVPDFFRLCAPGFVSLDKVSRAADLIDNKEDALWWGRLSRVTTSAEYSAIVEANKHARRTGHPSQTSVLLVGWCDEETYRKVVAPAVDAARESLESYTQLGDAIAWACGRAIGKGLPGPLGGNAGPVWDPYAADPVGRDRERKRREARARAGGPANPQATGPGEGDQ